MNLIIIIIYIPKEKGKIPINRISVMVGFSDLRLFQFFSSIDFASIER